MKRSKKHITELSVAFAQAGLLIDGDYVEDLDERRVVFPEEMTEFILTGEGSAHHITRLVLDALKECQWH